MRHVLLALASVAELFQEGSSLFQSGRFADAAARFEQAAKLAPRDARTWKALGASWAAAGDYERAAEPLEKACAIDPALDDACYFHGRNLYALNRFEPALAALKRALPRDRAAWRVHLAIGQASEALGKSAEAEAALRRSIELAGKSAERPRPDFDPRLHYAIFLFRQGRVAEALAPARETVQSWPEYGRGHFELGRILYHSGDLKGAVAELEKAVGGGYGEPAELLLERAKRRLATQ